MLLTDRLRYNWEQSSHISEFCWWSAGETRHYRRHRSTVCRGLIVWWPSSCVLLSVAVLGWARGAQAPPNLAQAPQIFDWFRSALFLLEGFWDTEICLKCVGFAPDPTGGAHDAPPDPLVGWGGGGGGHLLPRTPRLSAFRSSRFQRSGLAARRHVSSVYPPNFSAIHH